MSLCPDVCIFTLQKVIVLSVNGVLCFEDYNGFNPPVLYLANVICRPGLHDFFQILLQVFHVGIWSCMPPSRLDLVLAHLLLVELRSQLLLCMVKTSALGESHIHSSRSRCVDLQWAQELVSFANPITFSWLMIANGRM